MTTQEIPLVLAGDTSEFVGEQRMTDGGGGSELARSGDDVIAVREGGRTAPTFFRAPGPGVNFRQRGRASLIGRAVATLGVRAGWLLG